MNHSLKDLELIDSAPQAEFDNLTRLAGMLIDAPVSIVSIVDFDGDRQFFKSQVGLAEPWASRQETPLAYSFCQHVVRGNEMLAVEDAPADPRVADNLATTEIGVRAYLGAPVHTPNDQPVGALCVVDMKPRTWTAAQKEILRHLATSVSDMIKLNSARLTSEMLRREQRDFTYAISHDLKSPANTARLLLGEIAAERAVLSAEGREFFDGCVETVDRMTDQIENILDYTRTVGDRGAWEQVDLNQLFEGIRTDLRCDIERAGATLVLEDLPVITGNRTQLRSLFQNLVANGVKFRAPGRAPVVAVSACTDPSGRIDMVTVADNGIGIAAENQKKIFKIFARLHVREDYAGSGIGLALIRRICGNHNGNVSVVSEPGKGAAFTVRLPRRLQ